MCFTFFALSDAQYHHGLTVFIVFPFIMPKVIPVIAYTIDITIVCTPFLIDLCLYQSPTRWKLGINLITHFGIPNKEVSKNLIHMKI
jgi:hypothetical protein